MKEELYKGENYLLDRSQTGFREGLGCEVNILRLLDTIRCLRDINKSKHDKLWSLYIDEKSAFDTVAHEILFDKMKKLGISDQLRNSIEWLYQ